MIGKTNMAELAFGGPTSSAFGVTRNPWDLSRDPGSSSNGSGAATAAFMCATSLGEDTGGSIRNPSAKCGLVGLRPSWGRVSRFGVEPIAWSLDTVGPISRTVEDCAATLGVISGHDPKDRYSWNTPVPDYQSKLNGNVAGSQNWACRRVFRSSLFHSHSARTQSSGDCGGYTRESRRGSYACLFATCIHRRGRKPYNNRCRARRSYT